MVGDAGGDRAHAAGTPACARAHRGQGAVLRPAMGSDAGFDPASITSLDDLSAAPSYTVDDIRRASTTTHRGATTRASRRQTRCASRCACSCRAARPGKSRPTFYTQWDREVGALLTARALYMQGIRPGDVVLNSWAYGTHNGAFVFDEALYRWLDCVVAHHRHRQRDQQRAAGGAGDRVRGRRHPHHRRLPLAPRRRRAGRWATTPHPTSSCTRCRTSAIATLLESTFGVECFESYGFHEVQWVSVECPAHDGLHIFEDAFVVQIVDPETGEQLPDGEQSARCASPSSTRPGARSSGTTSWTCPRCTRASSARVAAGCARWRPFAGRGDNMVKLRGVNVWPEAVGELAMTVDGVAPDWFVRAVRREDRDELIVSVVERRATRRRTRRSRDAVERAPQGPAGRARSQPRWLRPAPSTRGPRVDVSPKLKRFRDER